MYSGISNELKLLAEFCFCFVFFFFYATPGMGLTLSRIVLKSVNGSSVAQQSASDWQEYDATDCRRYFDSLIWFRRLSCQLIHNFRMPKSAMGS